MATLGIERRLVAILAADVVGYSRLMRADEAGTLAQLKVLRKELVDRIVTEHRGRIVKLMGDGALVEFGNVAQAVECAVAIQHALAERSADLPENQRIRFRIGINAGDVIVEGDDLYGDAVNVAARLEGLAEPGGICISAKVFDEVRRKPGLGFANLGGQRVKNIPEPIGAYRGAARPGGCGHGCPRRAHRPFDRGAAVREPVARLLAGLLQRRHHRRHHHRSRQASRPAGDRPRFELRVPGQGCGRP